MCGKPRRITVGPMSMTLYDAIPKDGRPSNDALLDRFLDYVSASGLQLYPAQEEAILELFAEKNVILNTPTGLENRSSRRRCISRAWRWVCGPFTRARSRRS